MEDIDLMVSDEELMKRMATEPFTQSYDLQVAIKKKLTDKQEKFAFLISKGIPDFKAYKIAYNRATDQENSLRANANKTKYADGVLDAVDFFKKQQIAKQHTVSNAFDYTKDMAYMDLNNLQQRAFIKGDLRTELAIVSKKIDVAGLIVKKSEDVTPDRTLDAIDQQLKELFGKIPLDTLKKAMSVTDVTVKEIKTIENGVNTSDTE